MPSPLARDAYQNAQMPTLVVPERLADALEPESRRETIPPRVTLGRNAVPFAGELREQQYTAKKVTVAVGATVILATLIRPWNYIGFAVDPGSAGGAGVVAFLRIKTVIGDAALANVAVTAGGGLQAFLAQAVGARAELAVTNGTAVPITGVRGIIWGMGET